MYTNISVHALIVIFTKAPLILLKFDEFAQQYLEQTVCTKS